LQSQRTVDDGGRGLALPIGDLEIAAAHDGDAQGREVLFALRHRVDIARGGGGISGAAQRSGGDFAHQRQQVRGGYGFDAGDASYGIDEALAPCPPALPSGWGMDGRDHGVDRIEADIQVGNVEEAASEKRAERKQHHGEHDLQRNETVAQIPASGRRFDGADGGADQQHDARGKKRVEEEAVVALEMELEGNVVGRGPAQISEAAAQQRVEREPCGGAAGDQDERFAEQRAGELPAVGAERLADCNLAIAGGAAREQ
jgi:hypothetical protein